MTALQVEPAQTSFAETAESGYTIRMKHDTLFDGTDEAAETKADARAEADVSAGRLVSHGAVKRWLKSWGKAERLPRPKSGE